MSDCDIKTHEQLYQTVGELKGMTQLIHRDLQDMKGNTEDIAVLQSKVETMEPAVEDYVQQKNRMIGGSLVMGFVSGIFAILSGVFAFFGVDLPNMFKGG